MPSTDDILFDGFWWHRPVTSLRLGSLAFLGRAFPLKSSPRYYNIISAAYMRHLVEWASFARMLIHEQVLKLAVLFPQGDIRWKSKPPP